MNTVNQNRLMLRSLACLGALAQLASSAPALAGQAQIDLTQKLLDRNELQKSTEEVKPYLYDENVRERLAHWLNHPRTRDYVVDCQMNLRPFLQDPQVLGPVCYLLRQADPARRAQALSVVHRYWLELRTALGELKDDPRIDFTVGQKAGSLQLLFDGASWASIQGCFGPALKTQYNDNEPLAYSPFTQVTSCLNSRTTQITKASGLKMSYLGMNLSEEFPTSPGHAVSETGWIMGNHVQYLTENDHTNAMAQTLTTTADLMPTLYPLDGAGSMEAIKARLEKGQDVFTAQEGFLPAESHPIWSQPTGIFHELRQGVEQARESIFVDVFFLGGTMGASFAKHIIKNAEARNLKVFVLRDNINHFGHEAEMRPVYNYLKAYSLLHPERLVVSSARIEDHHPGIPKILWNVITDQVIQMTGIQKHLQLYARAQSDHSKVLVIDGKTPAPKAFVGSKNLTDISGAICFDEVAEVTGPIAAVVQDDYYEDMWAALQLETSADDLALYSSKGWSAATHGQAAPASSSWMSFFGTGADNGATRAMIANVLRPFDLLERDANRNASVSHVSVAAVGNTPIRTGFNAWDSTRASPLDEVIQSIQAAKRKILIKDQFLFDRNIVLALIEAKRKNPALDIRAILEPIAAGKPPGVPNVTYLDLLQAAGIRVKAKKTIENDKVNQEYHMKTVSVDGQSVITGSANKDQNTMYGSFREEQLDIFDAAATQVHDQAFEAHWASPDATYPEFSQLNFKPPVTVYGTDGKPLDNIGFIKLLRNVLAVLYDAT